MTITDNDKIMMFDDWKTPTTEHENILKRVKGFHDKTAPSKSMFFYGGSGTGKTSLALAIRNEAHATGRLAMYLTVQDVIGRCKMCMESGSMETPEAYIQSICNFKGLLILDELGRTKGGDWDKNQVIYPLIDKRMDRHNLWISNYSLDGLASHYDEAIASRLQIAMVLNFSDMEDYRGK